MSDLITWDNFFPTGGLEGPLSDFGYTTRDLATEIAKALDIQPGLPHTGQTDVRALAVEDLSPVMVSAEMQERQLTLWNAMPKEEAVSLDVEYVRHDTYGEDGMDGFIASNDSGTVSDPRWTRATKQIKYMGVLGQVTVPSQAVELVGLRGRGKNAMDTSEELKMRELLRHIERNLIWADSSLSSLHWDGLFKQIDAGANTANRIRLDMRGATADKEMLEYIAQIAADNSSDLTDLYFPNEGLRDLRQSIFPQQRSAENVRDGSFGVAFMNFLIESIGGTPDLMRIRRNQMLTLGVAGGIPRNVPTVVAGTPPTTSITFGAPVLAASPGTAFRPGLDAGTYIYSVTGVGKTGRSAAFASGAAAPAQNQQVTLPITCADATVLYYEVFRNPVDKSSTDVNNRKFVTRVARTGSTTNYVDDGYNIPDTYHVLCLSMAREELLFKQLLPVVKRALPQTFMANSYGILFFGTPLVKVPTHNIHIANVGQRPQAGVAST